jgi:phosphoglycolate phosphatase
LKLENKKLLIFDLDGTLINSALDLALAVNYMLETIKRDTFSEEIIHGWVGNGALILVKRALSGSRTVDERLDEVYVQKALKIFLDYYEKNLCNATVPYPHVISTLKTLKEKYTLAIVTNKPFTFVSPILKGLDMDGLFELILGGDSLSQKKPHSMPLLHVCEKLSVSVEASVMVGDSKNDILAANACNMDSVGVTYGYNYGEDIGVHKPTIIIDDFGDLLKSL